MKRTTIVTGGSWGVGLAIARRLGLDGFSVMVLATTPKEANQGRLDQFSAEGIEYHYVQGNLGFSEDRQRLVQEAVDRFGGIHVLVNNADVAPKARADLLKMSKRSSDFVVGASTRDNMLLTQAVAEQMLRQPIEGKKRGTVMSVLFCSAEVSSTNHEEYCVSRAGVSMLTTLYADRLVAEGILMNEVRPGVIFTDMTSSVREKYESLTEQGIFPIACWGTPEDVANAVGVFCGDEFLYTIGNYIDIDGGFHIKRP